MLLPPPKGGGFPHLNNFMKAEQEEKMKRKQYGGLTKGEFLRQIDYETHCRP